MSDVGGDAPATCDRFVVIPNVHLYRGNQGPINQNRGTVYIYIYIYISSISGVLLQQVKHQQPATGTSCTERDALPVACSMKSLFTNDRSLPCRLVVCACRFDTGLET